jgi:hypothetical protein
MYTFIKNIFLKRKNTIVNKNIEFLNIRGGGGVDNFYVDNPHWLNLDSNSYKPFIFNRNSIFPVDDKIISLAYNSHTLEHLDNDTLGRVFAETRRTLKDENSKLIIKIPDFDLIYNNWKNNNFEFFDDKFNFKAIAPSFKEKNIIDNINSRTAYLFCGFWNNSYGNLFGEHNPYNKGAYNGPAIMSDREIFNILNQNSIDNISKVFRNHIINNETDYTFNHQNSWSNETFKKILSKYGFVLLSENKIDIVKRYKSLIPDIENNYLISSYFETAKINFDQINQNWKEYNLLIKPLIINDVNILNNFNKNGFYKNVLRKETVNNFLINYPNIKDTSFSAYDYAPSYHTGRGKTSEEIVKKFNEQNVFKLIDKSFNYSLKEIIADINELIINNLGSYYKILNCRLWSSNVNADREYMYDFHSDSFIPEIYKIMIYFTPFTKEYGGLEMRINDKIIFEENNEKGVWILFKNTDIEHRGKPGTHYQRISMELTICRDNLLSNEINYGGTNAQYPIDPYYFDNYN